MPMSFRQIGKILLATETVTTNTANNAVSLGTSTQGELDVVSGPCTLIAAYVINAVAANQWLNFFDKDARTTVTPGTTSEEIKLRCNSSAVNGGHTWFLAGLEDTGAIGLEFETGLCWQVSTTVDYTAAGTGGSVTVALVILLP